MGQWTNERVGRGFHAIGILSITFEDTRGGTQLANDLRGTSVVRRNSASKAFHQPISMTKRESWKRDVTDGRNVLRRPRPIRIKV